MCPSSCSPKNEDPPGLLTFALLGTASEVRFVLSTQLTSSERKYALNNGICVPSCCFFLPPSSIFLCFGFLMFFDVRGWRSLRVPMQRSSASSISWRQMPSRCHQQPISDRKTNHGHGSHGTPQDLKMCESHSVIKCFCSWSICFRATRLRPKYGDLMTLDSQSFQPSQI